MQTVGIPHFVSFSACQISGDARNQTCFGRDAGSFSCGIMGVYVQLGGKYTFWGITFNAEKVKYLSAYREGLKCLVTTSKRKMIKKGALKCVYPAVSSLRVVMKTIDLR